MSRQEFRWKPRPALAGAPAYLHPWLSDTGSLTARIVARCGRFQVRVLGEQRALPFADECTLIGLPAGRHAWTREVLLLADDVPVVFAHSVLAPRDLNGAWHMARELGLNIFYGGHYQTETFAMKALASHLRETLNLPAEFIDTPCML